MDDNPRGINHHLTVFFGWVSVSDFIDSSQILNAPKKEVCCTDDEVVLC